jgi:hypothetical protein
LTSQPDQERWLPLAEAAQELGCSIETLRRHVKRGKVRAERMATPQGFAWSVCVGTLSGGDQLVNATSQAQAHAEVGELGRLVRELQAQVVERAELAAMWQVRAEVLMTELNRAQETIKALEAPKAEIASPGNESAETAKEQSPPWWRRWWAWSS